MVNCRPSGPSRRVPRAGGCDLCFSRTNQRCYASDGWIDVSRPLADGQGGTKVEEGFFSEVTEPIRFGGLDSTEPLSFKVYQPDRLVMGKRMEDHLRIGVCLWHSFAWDGRDMFGVGTLDRPWLDPAADPMVGGPPEDGRGVRVHREARRAVLLLPRPRRRSGGRVVRRVPRQPRRPDRRRARLPGADRAPRCCGARPTCSPTRATRPARRRTRIPRCSPTRPPRSSTCSR